MISEPLILHFHTFLNSTLFTIPTHKSALKVHSVFKLGVTVNKNHPSHNTKVSWNSYIRKKEIGSR